MAVTRHTQKDVGNYEAKLVGPLTTSQLITIAPGLVIAFLVGAVLSSFNLDAITIFIVCAILIVPFAIFAKAKPCGMKPMDYLKMYYKYHILAPPIRKYETETFDDLVFHTLGNISEIQPDNHEITSEPKSNGKKSSNKDKQDPEYPYYF